MGLDERVRQPGSGILQAISAYVVWGLLPVYWKAVQAVPPTQILAHRIFWSFILLCGVVTVRREWKLLAELARDGRTLRYHAVAAALLTVNWLTYIYGVNTDRIVETSLGYYVNPLVSVFLGVVVLHERLARAQWVAVGLAVGGVAVFTVLAGRLPWIAVVLAVTFGFYGLVKKQAQASAVPGLTLETGVVLVPAFAWLCGAELQGKGALGHSDALTNALLVGAGVVTALPLLLFSAAARKVRLSTMGLLQYVSPTCALLLGVLCYHEPFGAARMAGFALIWIGLGLFWWHGRGLGS